MTVADYDPQRSRRRVEPHDDAPAPVEDILSPAHAPVPTDASSDAGDPARPDPVQIERAREAGVTRVIFGLPPAPAETVLPILERCREVAGL